MAKIVLTDAKVTINSVILSDHISNVTIDTKDDVIDTTGFGSTAKTRVAGLGDNSVTFDFFQDFAAANAEATIPSPPRSGCRKTNKAHYCLTNDRLFSRTNRGTGKKLCQTI